MANSLERALALLELVDRTPGGLTNSDISRRLRIPTSTCSYITARLERHGYLLRDEDTRRFKIGLSPIALAHGALRELGFRSISEPVLYRIASETGLSAGIGVLERHRVMVVDRVESPMFINDIVRSPVAGAAARVRAARERTRDQRDIGRELPVHASALGKVLLAYLPADELSEFLEGITLARYTPKTITSAAKLRKEVESVRRDGHAIADEELYPNVRSVAIPIFDALRTVPAAISLNGELASPTWADLPGLVEKMEQAARAISARLTRE